MVPVNPAPSSVATVFPELRFSLGESQSALAHRLLLSLSKSGGGGGGKGGRNRNLKAWDPQRGKEPKLMCTASQEVRSNSPTPIPAQGNI